MPDQPNAVEEVRQLFKGIFNNKSNIQPIFVSFDVANGNSKGFSAIGASVLDPEDFKTMKTTFVQDHDHPLFRTCTYQFQYTRPGIRRTQRQFLFDGNVQKVSKELLPLGKIEEQTRPIIVVGHSVNCDIRSPEKAGFFIDKVAPVSAVLDTQKIARELYWKNDPSKNISLKNLCMEMGFKPAKLHICGNDDGYTLIALLCLAARVLGDEQEGEDAVVDGDTRRTLKQLIDMGLASAKSAKQKRDIERREQRGVDDWAKYPDGEEPFVNDSLEDPNETP